MEAPPNSEQATRFQQMFDSEFVVDQHGHRYAVQPQFQPDFDTAVFNPHQRPMPPYQNEKYYQQFEEPVMLQPEPLFDTAVIRSEPIKLQPPKQQEEHKKPQATDLEVITKLDADLNNIYESYQKGGYKLDYEAESRQVLKQVQQENPHVEKKAIEKHWYNSLLNFQVQEHKRQELARYQRGNQKISTHVSTNKLIEYNKKKQEYEREQEKFMSEAQKTDLINMQAQNQIQQSRPGSRSRPPSTYQSQVLTLGKESKHGSPKHGSPTGSPSRNKFHDRFSDNDQNAERKKLIQDLQRQALNDQLLEKQQRTGTPQSIMKPPTITVSSLEEEPATNGPTRQFTFSNNLHSEQETGGEELQGRERMLRHQFSFGGRDMEQAQPNSKTDLRDDQLKQNTAQNGQISRQSQPRQNYHNAQNPQQTPQVHVFENQAKNFVSMMEDLVQQTVAATQIQHYKLQSLIGGLPAPVGVRLPDSYFNQLRTAGQLPTPLSPAQVQNMAFGAPIQPSQPNQMAPITAPRISQDGLAQQSTDFIQKRPQSQQPQPLPEPIQPKEQKETYTNSGSRQPSVKFEDQEDSQEKQPLVIVDKKNPGFRKKFTPFKNGAARKPSEFDETPIKPADGSILPIDDIYQSNQEFSKEVQELAKNQEQQLKAFVEDIGQLQEKKQQIEIEVLEEQQKNKPKITKLIPNIDEMPIGQKGNFKVHEYEEGDAAFNFIEKEPTKPPPLTDHEVVKNGFTDTEPKRQKDGLPEEKPVSEKAPKVNKPPSKTLAERKRDHAQFLKDHGPSKFDYAEERGYDPLCALESDRTTDPKTMIPPEDNQIANFFEEDHVTRHDVFKNLYEINDSQIKHDQFDNVMHENFLYEQQMNKAVIEKITTSAAEMLYQSKEMKRHLGKQEQEPNEMDWTKKPYEDHRETAAYQNIYNMAETEEEKDERLFGPIEPPVNVGRPETEEAQELFGKFERQLLQKINLAKPDTRLAEDSRELIRKIAETHGVDVVNYQKLFDVFKQKEAMKNGINIVDTSGGVSSSQLFDKSSYLELPQKSLSETQLMKQRFEEMKKDFKQPVNTKIVRNIPQPVGGPSRVIGNLIRAGMENLRSFPSIQEKKIELINKLYQEALIQAENEPPSTGREEELSVIYQAARESASSISPVEIGKFSSHQANQSQKKLFSHKSEASFLSNISRISQNKQPAGRAPLPPNRTRGNNSNWTTVDKNAGWSSVSIPQKTIYHDTTTLEDLNFINQLESKRTKQVSRKSSASNSQAKIFSQHSVFSEIKSEHQSVKLPPIPIKKANTITDSNKNMVRERVLSRLDSLSKLSDRIGNSRQSLGQSLIKRSDSAPRINQPRANNFF